MHPVFSKASLFILISFAAVFESTRNSLHLLGDSVGGVGGVGGLTNQYGPRPWCNQTATNETGYCFHPGVFSGLTPYALVTTVFWISPLFIIAIGGFVEACGKKSAVSESLLKTSSDETPTSGRIIQAGSNLNTFKFGWTLLSFIWFINPLCAYMSSPFYRGSVVRSILGVSLAAAFPLSWSAMLVSLPMASGSSAGAALGLDALQLREAHIYMATWTGLWVSIHGVGEIIYLAASSELWSSLDLSSNGENLIYVFGVILLCFGGTHAVIAVFRRRWYSWFRLLHLPLALLLLVTATVHWWPFAFFMLPAAVAHSHEMAKRLWLRRRSRLQDGRLDEKGTVSVFENRHQRAVCSLALLAALCGALVALCAVWYGRQLYMSQADANAYIPFLFAGSSIVLSFLGSLISAGCVMLVLGDEKGCLHSLLLSHNPNSFLDQHEKNDMQMQAPDVDAQK